MRLTLPVLSNSRRATNAVEYTCRVYDRLPPDVKKKLEALRRGK